MAHDVTIRLSDDEYAAMMAEASKKGTTLDLLLREAVQQHVTYAMQNEPSQSAADNTRVIGIPLS